MAHIFNPNTNPIADDLLRLCLAPASRFTLLERRTIGRILAAKLYDTSLFAPRIAFRYLSGIGFKARGQRPVSICLRFDSDSSPEHFIRRMPNPDAGMTVIVLSAGVNGVVEHFNGIWNASASQRFWNEITCADGAESVGLETDSEAVPRHSDDWIRRTYSGDTAAGRDRNRRAKSEGDGGGRGRGGGEGGDGGGGRGEGSDGTGGAPGRGGTGEILNHPVLFSTDAITFDAILEQT